MKRNENKVRSLGRYIVSDPAVCHGKPTFSGTRIMVWRVLEMVSEGMDFDSIAKAWGNERIRKYAALKPALDFTELAGA